MLDLKQLKIEQPVWMLRNEQISPLRVYSIEDNYLILKTLESPPRYAPFSGENGSLHGSEKDARIAMIKEFEEDLQVRSRRLSAARAALNLHVRRLDETPAFTQPL